MRLDHLGALGGNHPCARAHRTDGKDRALKQIIFQCHKIFPRKNFGGGPKNKKTPPCQRHRGGKTAVPLCFGESSPFLSFNSVPLTRATTKDFPLGISRVHIPHFSPYTTLSRVALSVRCRGSFSRSQILYKHYIRFPQICKEVFEKLHFERLAWWVHTRREQAPALRFPPYCSACSYHGPSGRSAPTFCNIIAAQYGYDLVTV